ncbi:MAG: sterol desaturase family protein [Candidatus Kapabacteria bacterium]|nr:sterol desaturase family protein [Candidatus Kapabacteria bacterium]
MKFSLEFFSLLIIIVAAVIFVLLERIFPYTKNQRIFREGFWNDLIFYSIAQSYLLGVLITWFIQWIDNSTGFSRLNVISGLPIWGQVVFFVVTHDLYIYLFHRWMHNNKYLWRLHEAHHSTPEVDWLSGARSHSLEILINQTVEFAPIILLGAAPEVALYKGTISAIWGMYIHSNINVKSGWLQYIINGPEMHRWHHSAIYKGSGQNFATKLAIWDWIFGTAYLPKNEKPIRYGLDDDTYPINHQYKSQNVIIQFFNDFRNYIRQHIVAFRPFE